MSDYSVLDALADPAAVVGADVRLAIAETIARLLAIHGQFSAASLRPALINTGLSRTLIDKRMGAMISAAATKRLIVWTGEATGSGNKLSRNENRLVRVYTYGPKGAGPVADWVAGYQTDVQRTQTAAATLKQEAAAA